MKPTKYIIALIFSFTSIPIFAHQDFLTIREFGNVKTRIITGFHYEEIRKISIIGELAELLSKELCYTKPIFLDFHHDYGRGRGANYFLSFDKGSIAFRRWPEPVLEEEIFNEPAIVVRQMSREFDVTKTLQLLEYSIKNWESIEFEQKKFEHNYNRWTINTIDTLHSNEILGSPASQITKEVISNKIFRPEEKDFSEVYGISYYARNGKFFVFSKYDNKPDTTLLELKNIYQFQRVNYYSALIFDTDTSFYFVEGLSKPTVSRRHIIENGVKTYRPYKIDNIGGDKVSIFFSYFSKKENSFYKKRNLIYLLKEDDLIQDLDELFRSK